MLKTHMAACLMATGLIAAPALAQTSPTAPATNTAPVTTPAAPAGSTMGTNPNAPAGANTGAMNPGGANMAGGAFITQREPGMYSASELIGKDVQGSNNEDIGEIGDVLIDRSGQVRAIVVDVGGFLGIGETHVAIPMQQVQMRPNQQNAAAGGAARTTTGSPGATATGAGGAPATTAATGAAGQNTAVGNNAQQPAAGANRGTADMVIIVMTTKDQLQNAPKFEDRARR